MTNRPRYGLLTTFVILSIGAGIWKGAYAGVCVFLGFMLLVLLLSAFVPGDNGAARQEQDDITKTTPPDKPVPGTYEDDHPLIVIHDYKQRGK